MLLPAIREKISSLPRTLKTLLLISSILVLVIIAEVSYYLWASKMEAEESKYINTNMAYQEGVFLYDKVTKKPIAIRGWVIDINGSQVKIENQGMQKLVIINNEFRYVKIKETPIETLSSKSLETILSEIGDKTNSLEAIRNVRKEELLKQGVVYSPEKNSIKNLSEVVKIGDFVVIDLIEIDDGTITGESISVLEALRRQ